MDDLTTAYPEHAKLKALDGHNEIVGDFLEWLAHRQYTVCFWGAGKYHPARKQIEDWLADYFDVDMKALDREKQAMLDTVRPTPVEVPPAQAAS